MGSERESSSIFNSNIGGGGIPGLDVAPESQDANKEKKEKTPNKMLNKSEEIGKDDKIDVKLNTHPLNIGPIGVPNDPPQKFVMPGDWYDDEDENEKKDEASQKTDKEAKT